VDKIIIPDHSTPVIKAHSRIMVPATQPPWTSAGISVELGESVLVLASGKADIGSSRRDIGPHGSHFSMKVGDATPITYAVGPASRNLFKVTTTGVLKFGIVMNPLLGPDRQPAEWYLSKNNKGGYRVDVFVFTVGSIEEIKPVLSEIAQANPKDEVLNQQIKKIVEFKTPDSILSNTKLSLKISKDPIGQFLDLEQRIVKAQAPNTLVGPQQLPRAHVDGGHLNAITCMAISSDGKHVITGGQDNKIKLWEMATGREIRDFKGHTDVVTSVAFSPDNRQVVSGSRDRTLRTWDVSNGEVVREYTGSESSVTSVVFHPDGTRILSSDQQDFIRVWETLTGKLDKKLVKYGAVFSSIAISADGRTVISGSLDGSVCLWDMDHRKPVHVFAEANSAVEDIVISKDGNIAATGGRDQIIRIWDIREKKLRYALSGHENAVTALTINPAGDKLISAAWDNTCRIWNVSEGKPIDTIDLNGKSASVLTITPDGKQLVAGMEDKNIRLFSLKKQRLLRTFIKSERKIAAAKFSRDGKYALSTTNQFIQLWDLASGSKLKQYNRHQSTVSALAFDPNGVSFVSGDAAGLIYRWDLHTGKLLGEYKGHRSKINDLYFGRDGRRLLSGSADRTLRIWDVATGRQVQIFSAGHDPVTAVRFSSGGNYVFSGGGKRIVRLWDVVSGKEVRPFGGLFNGYDIHATLVSFSHSGHLAVSESSDQVLRLWEILPSGSVKYLRSIMRRHPCEVKSLTFSSDDRYILAGSSDNRLRLWNHESAMLIKEFPGHMGPVMSTDISQGGKSILSGAADGTLRLWSLNQNQEIVQMNQFANGEWITLSPDGYYNCSTEGGNSIYWVYPNGTESFSFAQFESFFKKPQILKARLSGNQDAGVPVPEMIKPPRIQMPDHLDYLETDKTTYTLNLTAFASKELSAIRIFNNGRPVKEIIATGNKKEISDKLPLINGVNRITAIAYDRNGFSSNPRYADVFTRHRRLKQPILHIVAAGVSQYPRLPPKWQLEYAHTDAASIVESFRKQEGNLFGEVRYHLLSNREANSRSILKLLADLKDISPSDIVVVFFAGHGIKTEAGRFYFLTYNGSLERVQEGGIDWNDLKEHLYRIKGRTLVLLDACHSGSIVTETVVPNDELAKEFFSGKRSGVMVFSASKGRQFSLESPDIGDGAGIFTYSLTQGLGPKSKEADIDENGYVEFLELVDYVRGYVDKATIGQQTPWLSRKELFGDLPIAAVRN